MLDIIRTILKAEAEGAFPSLEECQNISKREAFRNGTSPATWFCRSYQGQEEILEESSEEGLEEESEPQQQNGISVIYDVPMRQDLNKKSTVKGIMEYTQKIASFILKSSENTNDVVTSHTPILQDCCIAMGGDGSPIMAAQNIMREEDNLKSKIIASFGGFHLMLKSYKKRGSLFEHTHLRHIFSLFRESTKSQDFVLQPSDPGQAKSENTKIHLAIILNALRKLIYIKKNRLDVDSLFDDNFDDVIDESDDELYDPEEEDSYESEIDDEYDELALDETELSFIATSSRIEENINNESVEIVLAPTILPTPTPTSNSSSQQLN